LGAILAAIMIVYGGFRYMLSASLPEVETGKKIIQDSFIGLVVLLTSFLILKTINPQLVQMSPIRVQRIREEVPVSTSEFTGNPLHTGYDVQRSEFAGTCGRGGTQTLDGLPFTVLPLRGGYEQGSTPWANISYGSNLASNESNNPCKGDGPDGTGFHQPIVRGCTQTFRNGGCGVTAFAEIMAYYGQRVTNPGDAALATNIRMWNGDQLVPLSEHPHGQDILARMQSRVQTHLFDPIDAARLAVARGNAGEGGHATTDGTDFMAVDGFRKSSFRDPAQAAQAIRAGNPLVIYCNKCQLKQRSIQDPDHVGGKHFMVLHGVSQDGQWFLIHDVGGGGTAGGKFISAEQIRSGRSSEAPEEPSVNLISIIPTNAQVQPCNTTTETAGTDGSSNGPVASGSRPSTPSVSGEVTHFTYPFIPAAATGDPGWGDVSAAILPTRLMTSYNTTGGTRPRARLYIYLHGQNGTGATTAAALRSGTLHDMEQTLSRVAGSKNIIIVAPRYITTVGRSYFNRMDLGEFYRTTLAALRTQIPGFQESDIQDVVVSGHSSATCSGPGSPMLKQALTANFGSTRLRGIVGYDGCLGDAVQPSSFSPRDNISIYLNPDLGRNGMGIHGNGDGSGGHPERYKNVRTRWDLRRITCPSYVENLCPEGTPVEPSAPDYNQRRCNACYGKTSNGTETISFETSYGHNESVSKMTDYMFRAFYGN
jgi:hypothetical protein